MKSKNETKKEETKTAKTKKKAATGTKTLTKKATGGTKTVKKAATGTAVKKTTAKKTVVAAKTVKKTPAKKTTGKMVPAKTKAVKTKTAKKSKVLLDTIVSALDKNKAENIVVIDLEGKSSLADYMVVASGRSQKQVGALADIVSKDVKTKMGKISVIEGRGKSDWAVMDFGDVIVHIFHPEARDFYKLEEIWQD